MSTSPHKKDEFLTENDNILQFKKPDLILPKPDGTKPTHHDWLIELPEGTVFLAAPRPKEQAGMYIERHVIKKFDNCVLLLDNLNEPETFMWVNSIGYSQALELVRDITPEEDQEQT